MGRASLVWGAFSGVVCNERLGLKAGIRANAQNGYWATMESQLIVGGATYVPVAIELLSLGTVSSEMRFDLCWCVNWSCATVAKEKR